MKKYMDTFRYGKEVYMIEDIYRYWFLQNDKFVLFWNLEIIKNWKNSNL